MATDLNRVMLIGRLTRDPVLQATSSGINFTKISIASNKTYYTKDGQLKEEVYFFDCTAWGKLAETICKYLNKGRQIAIDGSLRYSSWENTEGKKQSRIEINIDNFQFLGSKGQRETSANQPSPNSKEYNATNENTNIQESNFSENPSDDPFQKADLESINDDDIPF